MGIRICFVGDSFVNGTGDETALGWAGRLCALAVSTGAQLTYYNLGVRRDTSQDILLRWQRECSHRLPEDCDGRIVISFGVNDTMLVNGVQRITLDESLHNLRDFLSGAAKYTLLMVGPPPVADAVHNSRIGNLSAALRQEARKLGLPFVELFSPLVNDSDYQRDVAAGDGAHPHAAGYVKMANIIGASKAWWFCAA
jgi:acyl-CoA thioesterase-1